MLTHYQIFRNRFFWPSQQVPKLPVKEGIYHFFHTFLRVLGAVSKLRLEIGLLDNWIVFTWRHNHHVDVPNPSCGSWTFFLCKNVFFFQFAYLRATWVKRLILKHCEQWKRRPTIFVLFFFFVRPSSNVDLFITKLLQLSTRKDWRLNQLSLTYLIWLDPCAHGNSDLGATSTDFHVPNLMHKWLSFIFTGNRCTMLTSWKWIESD